MSDVQVMTQPLFAFVENTFYNRFGKTVLMHSELQVRICGITWVKLTVFKLVWRTAYVCFTTCKHRPAAVFLSSYPQTLPQIRLDCWRVLSEQ